MVGETVLLRDPLPSTAWQYDSCIAMWPEHQDVDGETGTQVAAFDGSVEIGCGRYEPETARQIAADLLAAANIAERGVTGEKL